MSDITVRLAEPHEYEEAGRLTVAAYAADGYESPDGNYASVLRDAANRASNAELFVAVPAARWRVGRGPSSPGAPSRPGPTRCTAGTGGGLIGTMTYCPYGSRYAELAGPGEADLRMLAVVAAARGRGIGEALVRHALRRAREQRFERLVLSTAEYMTTAHRLYERLGFERVPQRDWRPSPEVPLRAYTMAL